MSKITDPIRTAGPIETRDAGRGWRWRPLETRDAGHYVIDPKTGRGYVTRDERLDAIPVGKALARGMVYEGDSMTPLPDFLADAMRELDSGFSAGRILHAEGPGGRLDPGSVYDGLARYFAGKAADARRKSGDRRGLTADEQRARDEVAATRERVSSINEANKRFWADPSRSGKSFYRGSGAPAAAPTRDAPRTAVASGSSSMRERIEAINSANARFWADRNSPDAA